MVAFKLEVVLFIPPQKTTKSPMSFDSCHYYHPIIFYPLVCNPALKRTQQNSNKTCLLLLLTSGYLSKKQASPQSLNHK